nr:MAG TPA_asm: hypothetical protein [Caudoviricetes sp.]
MGIIITIVTISILTISAVIVIMLTSCAGLCSTQAGERTFPESLIRLSGRKTKRIVMNYNGLRITEY